MFGKTLSVFVATAVFSLSAFAGVAAERMDVRTDRDDTIENARPDGVDQDQYQNERTEEVRDDLAPAREAQDDNVTDLDSYKARKERSNTGAAAVRKLRKNFHGYSAAETNDAAIKVSAKELMKDGVGKSKAASLVMKNIESSTDALNKGAVTQAVVQRHDLPTSLKEEFLDETAQSEKSAVKGTTAAINCLGMPVAAVKTGLRTAIVGMKAAREARLAGKSDVEIKNAAFKAMRVSLDEVFRESKGEENRDRLCMLAGKLTEHVKAKLPNIAQAECKFYEADAIGADVNCD